MLSATCRRAAVGPTVPDVLSLRDQSALEGSMRVHRLQTHDKIIHEVNEPERVDYKGVLTCGLIYTTKTYGKSKWLPSSLILNPRDTKEVVVKRTSKRPTCLWCIAGVAR